jgi:hypothetical protein
MPIGTTAAVLIGSALAASATAYGAETARQGQKKAMRFQETQQKAAEAMGLRERENAAMERKRMEGKVPDVAALLTGEQGAQGRGAASSMLTGQSGAAQQTSIGKNRLLGE